MKTAKPKPTKPRANYNAWARECYSPCWDHVSRTAKQLTSGKCCLCRAKATTTHHAFYTQGGAGDKPGHNLFPLCAKHHRHAHQLRRRNRKTGKFSGQWVVVSKHPVTGRCNTKEFLQRLRQGWAQTTGQRRPAPTDDGGLWLGAIGVGAVLALALFAR